MKVGDLVKVRRMSGLMTPLFGMIVQIKKWDNRTGFERVAIVKPLSGPLQPANQKDVEVISESR
mgnify:FL=1